MNGANVIKYVNELNEIRNMYTSVKSLKGNPKVEDCRISKEPLIETLIKNGMIMHPFIIQCIFPKCREHFNNQDEFKQHLMEVHIAGQNEANNFEMYALMLIYNNNEKYHLESSNDKYAEVLGYWLKKRRCIFEHCNFKGHQALNNGTDHVMFYMKECLNFNFITDTQALVIDALSPIWKVLLMERLYHIVGWKIRTPFEMLIPRKGKFLRDVVTIDETYDMDMQDYDDESWDEIEEENDAALNDIKKAKSVNNWIKHGITRHSQDERNRWKLEIDHRQMPAERKPMNKTQFAQREYVMRLEDLIREMPGILKKLEKCKLSQ
jgi:hypothetical protein